MSRSTALHAVLTLLIVLAGCGGSTQPDERTIAPRFDGDANAEVEVQNSRNHTSDVTFVVEREGEVLLNRSKTLPPEAEWNVTTIDRPGNYTFTVRFADTNPVSKSVRLPRAHGDRKTFVIARWHEDESEIQVFWQQ